MTREGDYFVPLEVRAQIANAAPDSIFVSIHFNATDRDPNATGFEIFSFTPRGAPSTSDTSLALSSLDMQAGSTVDTQSMALSSCIYHSLLGHIPEFDRGIKRARFAVLRLTRVPAVLIEGGFLTERGESELIAKNDWRTKLAQSISVGIQNYQALADKKQPPLLVADYRRQGGLQPVESVITVADSSLVNLVGESELLSSSPPAAEIAPAPSLQQPQLPTSLESAVIIP
jgi:N-acetylmuramoyl-L-alanine amidase